MSRFGGSSTTFDFVLPSADKDDPMMPVGDVVDVDVGQVFPVGLFGFEMLGSWHTIRLYTSFFKIAATFTTGEVPESVVSSPVMAVPLSG